MKINWEKLFRNEQKQFEAMSEARKFEYFLLLQVGSPYGWGEENPEASDCSGGVCLALAAATGLLARVTADVLYKQIFTVKNPRGGIRAAFWITPEARRHVDRTVAAGTATHVAGVVGRGNAVLSAEEPCSVVSAVEAVPAMGRAVEIRGLDRAALAKAAQCSYGVEAKFWDYFQK